MNVYDTLHALIDRAAIHDPKDAELLHDAVTAQEQGYKTAEEYRKAQAAKQPAGNADEEDALLARADEIRKQREAQAAANADQQRVIAEREQAARPATPAAVPPTTTSAAPLEPGARTQPGPPTGSGIPATEPEPTAPF